MVIANHMHKYKTVFTKIHIKTKHIPKPVSIIIEKQLLKQFSLQLAMVLFKVVRWL